MQIDQAKSFRARSDVHWNCLVYPQLLPMFLGYQFHRRLQNAGLEMAEASLMNGCNETGVDKLEMKELDSSNGRKRLDGEGFVQSGKLLQSQRLLMRRMSVDK